MPDGTRCGECKEPILGEPPSTPGDQRKPCPKCGSTKRIFDVSVTMKVTIEHLLAVSKATPPTPNVLLQAVVEREGKTPDGDIIISLQPAWRIIVELLEKNPNAAFDIDPIKWEEIIAASYDEAGFDEVILTPRSGDKGRDVIATKRGLFRVRFIDQVKAYAPGNKVTANDVRAMLGVLHADPNATKGLVTTTSDFAPKIAEEQGIVQYIPNRLELINGDELIKRLRKIADGDGV